MQGLGVVFGLVAAHQISAGGIYQANDTPTVGALTLTKFNDGVSVSVGFSRDIVFDEDGVPRVAINHGTLWTAEFEFTPKGAAKTDAEGQLHLVKHGATLTVSTMKLGCLNTVWALTGCSVRFVKAGVTTYTLSCQRSPESDITTLVS